MKISKFLLYLALLATTSLLSCKQKPAPLRTQPACYFWKSQLILTASELHALDSLHVKSLYTKLFDVDWDALHAQVIPIALLRIDSTTIAQLQARRVRIVPVVFLTVRALQHTTNPSTLATNIEKLVTSISTQLHQPITALQLDCDWTTSTRATYFALLTALRSELPPATTLSATIRLHQVKYRARTGIPPVDRGMLMFYNMADWQSPTTHNSIFDPDVAAAYTDYIHDYPLPLDIALPIFHWTIVYRNDQFFTILHNLTSSELQRLPDVQARDATHFTVTANTTIQNVALRPGDMLRSEAVPIATLRNAISDLAPRLRNRTATITLFDLDSTTLAAYDIPSLAKLLN